jgi:hypothetical protein
MSRTYAWDAADNLLCLLEALGIKSAGIDVCTEEMLDEFMARTHHLWRNNDAEERPGLESDNRLVGLIEETQVPPEGKNG